MSAMFTEEKTDLRVVVGELMRTERMHKAIVDSRVSTLGIRRSSFLILMEIDRAVKKDGGRPLSQKNVADMFGISPAAVAMTLKKIEGEGYIRRVMKTADNRYNELFLTEKGEQILSETKKIFDKLDRETYEGIPEADLRCMLRCLEKMQNNLSGMPEPVENEAFFSDFDKAHR